MWREQRTQELITTPLGEVSEDNSDEEDEVEEMWTAQDLYEEVCALETRLFEVEARLDEAESAAKSSSSNSSSSW